MSNRYRFILAILSVASLIAGNASAVEPGAPEKVAAASVPQGYAVAAKAPTGSEGDRKASPAEAKAPVKPFRTWIAVQRYNMENNGEPSTPISNVRIEITFPNGSKLPLPEGGQYWPIGNGQVQEINRTFEIPWAWVQNDGFTFAIQMYRKGSEMLPCKFDVTTLSQFNRAYICRTDTNWQTANKTAAENLDRESIQIRVFTDLNSQPNEIPNDAIALK